MTPVVSVNIRAVGYGHDLQVLRVTFKSGGSYEYFDVAPQLYKEMLLPHPWRRVGGQVRAHRFRRLA
ncbi:hypothetical protein GCM10009735_80900 [Actinomadura chokoriensis]